MYTVPVNSNEVYINHVRRNGVGPSAVSVSYHILCTRYACVCACKTLSVLGICCEILPVPTILYIYHGILFSSSLTYLPQFVHRIQSKTWSISSTGACLHRPPTTHPPHARSHYFTSPHASLIQRHMKRTGPSIIKVTINCTKQVTETRRLLGWGHPTAGHDCQWIIIEALGNLDDTPVNAHKIFCRRTWREETSWKPRRR
jgi:hypothetical protein